MPSLATWMKRVPWQGTDTPYGSKRTLLLCPVILLLQAQGARVLDWQAEPGLAVKLGSVIGDGPSPLRLGLAGLAPGSFIMLTMLADAHRPRHRGGREAGLETQSDVWFKLLRHAESNLIDHGELSLVEAPARERWLGRTSRSADLIGSVSPLAGTGGGS